MGHIMSIMRKFEHSNHQPDTTTSTTFVVSDERPSRNIRKHEESFNAIEIKA